VHSLFCLLCFLCILPASRWAIFSLLPPVLGGGGPAYRQDIFESDSYRASDRFFEMASPREAHQLDTLEESSHGYDARSVTRSKARAKPPGVPLSSSTSAQGAVYALETKRPISGALVRLQGSRCSDVTSRNGHFQLKNCGGYSRLGLERGVRLSISLPGKDFTCDSVIVDNPRRSYQIFISQECNVVSAPASDEAPPARRKARIRGSREARPIVGVLEASGEGKSSAANPCAFNVKVGRPLSDFRVGRSLSVSQGGAALGGDMGALPASGNGCLIEADDLVLSVVIDALHM